MPASLRVTPILGVPDVSVDDANEMWVGEQDATIIFSVSDGRGQYFLGVGGGERPIEEVSCRAPLAGRAAVWHLVAWLGPSDTTFMAVAGAVLDRGLALNVGVLADSRSTREAILRTVLSLERRP